jgi:outer membrane biosynthesis protein TonB
MLTRLWKSHSPTIQAAIDQGALAFEHDTMPEEGPLVLMPQLDDQGQPILIIHAIPPYLNQELRRQFMHHAFLVARGLGLSAVRMVIRDADDLAKLTAIQVQATPYLAVMTLSPIPQAPPKATLAPAPPSPPQDPLEPQAETSELPLELPVQVKSPIEVPVPSPNTRRRTKVIDIPAPQEEL